MDQHFHGTEEHVEQYALGRLSDSDLTVFEEHLLVCAACRERLDQVEDFALGMREALTLDGMQSALQPETLPWWSRFGLPEWLSKPGFALALAGAALVLVVGLSLTGRNNLAPAASLQLTAMRGEMPSSVPAKELDITLGDLPQTGGPFRIEIVNSTGKSEWTGTASVAAGGAQLEVHKTLSPGDYFVRLYTPEGTLVHEYGFRVRT